eukprot:PITA_35315
MAFNGLKLEYALDGSSNYIAWKDRMEAVLEDNGLKNFIDQEVPKPTDKTELVEWGKCVARARIILLEGVRDHIVSSLHGKESPFAMWKTLKDLYQNSSDQRKLALKDKLRKIKCEKGDSISTFLNKLITYRDDLASVGVTTADEDMEEIRRSTRDGASSSKHDDEENLALASKAKKGKGKASHSKSSQGGKKFDKLKVRCFHFHELGHYANNCPKRKSKKKGSSKESDGDALASQFEMDLSLITCMVSSSMGCVWYLDSGASFHMLGDKNLFSTLEEKDLKARIEMGDDGKYCVSGRGTVMFQRENGSPLTLSNVMYVPGLKKNLVSIDMLEDKGYGVVFSLGKVFLRHIGIRQTKQIGIRIKNLYKLQVEYCVALSSKVEVVHGQDISELWHRRLGHLHHGAFKIMQQISTGLPKCN